MVCGGPEVEKKETLLRIVPCPLIQYYTLLQMTPLKLFVIGGHGKVGLHFTRLASQAGHTVISQIRNPDHISDLPTPGPGKVEALVKDLENLSVEQISELFTTHDPNVILFTAGAGGKGGKERTMKVDRDGAIKVFDAIEKSRLAQRDSFRRFLLVSAVDIREVEKTKPEWYKEEE
jgi:nucleoside-diphosphate-sugar epimerase